MKKIVFFMIGFLLLIGALVLLLQTTASNSYQIASNAKELDVR